MSVRNGRPVLKPRASVNGSAADGTGGVAAAGEDGARACTSAIFDGADGASSFSFAASLRSSRSPGDSAAFAKESAAAPSVFRSDRAGAASRPAADPADELLAADRSKASDGDLSGATAEDGSGGAVTGGDDAPAARSVSLDTAGSG
jgi:hypothetical protein